MDSKLVAFVDEVGDGATVVTDNKRSALLRWPDGSKAIVQFKDGQWRFTADRPADELGE